MFTNFLISSNNLQCNQNVSIVFALFGPKGANVASIIARRFSSGCSAVFIKTPQRPRCHYRLEIASVVAIVSLWPTASPSVRTFPTPDRPGERGSPRRAATLLMTGHQTVTSQPLLWSISWCPTAQCLPLWCSSTVESGNRMNWNGCRLIWSCLTLNELFLIDDDAARLLPNPSSTASEKSLRPRRLNESTVSSKSTSELKLVDFLFARNLASDDRTSSSNSSIAAPMLLFGTRWPRTSKKASSVIARSARRLAFSIGSLKIGSLNGERAGELMGSGANGLRYRCLH